MTRKSNLHCFVCENDWISKHKDYSPKVCPACGNDWRTPSMSVRFLAAWRGFQKPFLVREAPRRRVKVDLSDNPDPLATEASLYGTAADGANLPQTSTSGIQARLI
jgi:hypothetical protein